MRVEVWAFAVAIGCGEPAAAPAPSAEPPVTSTERSELPPLPEVVPPSAAPGARVAVDVAPLPALDGDSPESGPASPAPTGVTPMEDAMEAMARGDSMAVVRALEGRTRTPRELALLIETYRSLGNTSATCRNVDLYIRRYPSTPQANNYRMTLAQICE